MRLKPVLIILALLATPVATPAWATAVDLIGRWTGTLHTLQGNCPDQAPSTLVISAKQLSFAPADGVLVLHGAVGSNPSRLHAQLRLPGVNHKPYPMVFEAHPDGDTVTGLYGTPACRAEITLRRPADRSLKNALGR